MNIIKELVAHVEKLRLESRTPCKNYATESNADKAAREFAIEIGEHFTRTSSIPRPCRYIVVYVESLGRWVVAFDMSEMLNRDTTIGGYLGIAGQAGFLTF